MWKLFGTDGGSETPDGSASPMTPSKPAVSIASSIADVKLMGQTAVATLTVNVLSASEGVEALAELLFSMEESGARHFVLDIQNVEYMDSACLGCMVESLNRLATSGGKIALVNPAHCVQHLFRLTQLDRVFRICPDVMAALQAVEDHER